MPTAPLTALVTILAMGLYFVLTFNVGRARLTYNVVAPRTDGPEEFQRRFRVHMNTLEQLALFLPLLWIAALYANDLMAALFGCVWIGGRIAYAVGYYRDAAQRRNGFLIGIAAIAALAMLALYGTLNALLTAY